MDGNELTNYETTTNQETGETNLVIIHPEGNQNIVITGIKVVPGFLCLVSILLAELSGVIVLARMLLLFSEGILLPN